MKGKNNGQEEVIQDKYEKKSKDQTEHRNDRIEDRQYK